MVHRANVYRPTLVQNTAQELGDYTSYAEGVPCFIQPYTVQEAFYYEQRGQEGVAALYTTDLSTAFDRNDIFEYRGTQYHVTAVKENLCYQLYRELTVFWYPETARRRLNRPTSPPPPTGGTPIGLLLALTVSGFSPPPPPPPPTGGSPIGLLLALTTSTSPPPPPGSGEPMGMMLALTKA